MSLGYSIVCFFFRGFPLLFFLFLNFHMREESFNNYRRGKILFNIKSIMPQYKLNNLSLFIDFYSEFSIKIKIAHTSMKKGTYICYFLSF